MRQEVLVVVVVADPALAVPHTQTSRYPPRHLYQHPPPRLVRLPCLANGPHPRLRTQGPALSRRRVEWHRPCSFNTTSSSGQSTSGVLDALRIFETLYSARAMWISPTYDEVCKVILCPQAHRDSHVRAALIHVLPMCARYDFVRFTTSFPRRRMRFYLGIWAQGTGYHSQGALGALAGAVNTEIKSYIKSVFKIDKNCL